ncbi:MAG: hypothetical protein ACOY9Y_10750 [Bacillota bacterium]
MTLFGICAGLSAVMWFTRKTKAVFVTVPAAGAIILYFLFVNLMNLR